MTSNNPRSNNHTTISRIPRPVTIPSVLSISTLNMKKAALSCSAPPKPHPYPTLSSVPNTKSTKNFNSLHQYHQTQPRQHYQDVHDENFHLDDDLKPLTSTLHSMAQKVKASKSASTMHELSNGRIRVLGQHNGRESYKSTQSLPQQPISAESMPSLPPPPALVRKSGQSSKSFRKSYTALDVLDAKSNSQIMDMSSLSSSSTLNTDTKNQQTNSYQYVPPASLRVSLWDNTPIGQSYSYISKQLCPKTIQIQSTAFKALLTRLNQNGFIGFGVGRFVTDNPMKLLHTERADNIAKIHDMALVVDRFDAGTMRQGNWQPTIVMKNDVVVPINSGDDFYVNLLDKFQSVIRTPLDLSSLDNVTPACVSWSMNGSVISMDYRLLVPGWNIRLTPIRPLRVVPTTLATDLMNRRSDSNPDMGYITIDQSRTVLPLTAQDPTIRELPLFGIWLSGISQVSDPIVYKSLLHFALSTSGIQPLMQTSTNTMPSRMVILLALYSSTSNSSPVFYECALETKSTPFDVFGVSSSVELGDVENYRAVVRVGTGCLELGGEMGLCSLLKERFGYEVLLADEKVDEEKMDDKENIYEDGEMEIVTVEQEVEEVGEEDDVPVEAEVEVIDERENPIEVEVEQKEEEEVQEQPTEQPTEEIPQQQVISTPITASNDMYNLLSNLQQQIDFLKSQILAAGQTPIIPATTTSADTATTRTDAGTNTTFFDLDKQVTKVQLLSSQSNNTGKTEMATNTTFVWKQDECGQTNMNDASEMTTTTTQDMNGEEEEENVMTTVDALMQRLETIATTDPIQELYPDNVVEQVPDSTSDHTTVVESEDGNSGHGKTIIADVVDDPEQSFLVLMGNREEVEQSTVGSDMQKEDAVPVQMQSHQQLSAPMQTLASPILKKTHSHLFKATNASPSSEGTTFASEISSTNTTFVKYFEGYSMGSLEYLQKYGLLSPNTKLPAKSPMVSNNNNRKSFFVTSEEEAEGESEFLFSEDLLMRVPNFHTGFN